MTRTPHGDKYSKPYEKHTKAREVHGRAPCIALIRNPYLVRDSLRLRRSNLLLDLFEGSLRDYVLLHKVIYSIIRTFTDNRGH